MFERLACSSSGDEKGLFSNQILCFVDIAVDLGDGDGGDDDDDDDFLEERRKRYYYYYVVLLFTSISYFFFSLFSVFEFRLAGWRDN